MAAIPRSEERALKNGSRARVESSCVHRLIAALGPGMGLGFSNSGYDD